MNTLKPARPGRVDSSCRSQPDDDSRHKRACSIYSLLLTLPGSPKKTCYFPVTTKMRHCVCPGFCYQISGQPVYLPCQDTHAVATNVPPGDGNSARKELSPIR